MAESVTIDPVVIITGSSAGLGFHIAEALHRQGYRVVLVGRDQDRISAAAARLGNDRAFGFAADVTQKDAVDKLFADVNRSLGRLDVLVNCVGMSDRGLIENLSVDHLNDLLTRNVTATLLCCQAAIGPLESSGGVIVNIGSLASKVSARYVGGYSIAKHALAGLTGQLRLELKDRGIHVALISPGPIRRDDAGTRYQDKIHDGLPAQAAQPGAGTRVKGLDPNDVANAVLTCIHRRQPDVVRPGYLRILIAVGHAFPRLGDWLLLKFTSSGSKASAESAK